MNDRELNFDFVGLEEAIKLAESLLKFPQNCMNRDRRSAYNAMYDASSYTDAMQYEFVNGMKVIHEEAIPGVLIQRVISLVHQQCTANICERLNLKTRGRGEEPPASISPAIKQIVPFTHV